MFATLFFPETLFRERVTIPVTAILTSAVLLLAVDNQLGDVGYTVAVEKIFYVFFALCLLAMLAGFGHETIAARRQEASVRRRGSHRPSPLCRNGARGHRLVLVALCAMIRAPGFAN